MMIPKRLLVLAGCALILAACTQDTVTAPPVAAEVGVEGIADAPGSEAGKITLTLPYRGATYCNVKIALTNLYDDATNDYDWYYLKLSSTPEYQSSILAVSKRGTYRGSSEILINNNMWASATEMWLGYYNGTDFTPTHIADMAAGVLSDMNPNFTVVDRCH